MANKDLRMTAVFSVRDQLSPVIQKLSKSWKGLRDALNSDAFKKLNSQFGKFKRSLSNVTSQVQSAAGKMALPLTAAASAVGFSLSQMMSKFLSTGDGIDKATIRLGISAEKLQTLRYAAGLSGASVETMDKSLAKLNENLAKAAAGKNQDLADLMKKLGINTRDANGNLRSAADILPEFADGIKRNRDAGLRARMAIAAFGEEGQALIPMLEGGAAGLKEMEDEAKRLGLTMSEEDVKAAAGLGDDFSRLGQVFDSFGNTLSAKIAPVLAPIIKDLTEFIAKNKEAFSQRVSQAIASFANALRKIDFQKIADTCVSAFSAIGKFFDSIGGFETVLKVIGALLAGKLIMGIVGFVGSLLTLGQTFMGLIPLVRTVGLMMAGGLGPVMLAVGALIGIVALIYSNWDKLGPYFSALWDGICSTFNSVVEKVKSYFLSLIDNIKAIWRGFCEGDFSTLIKGFVGLFTAPFNLLPDSMKEVGKKLIASAGDIISDIGKSFTDFFSSLNLSDMLPDSFKNGLNWISDKLGFGSKSSVPAPVNSRGMATVPGSEVYGGMPVGSEAKVDGTIKVEVTATNGASAQVSETDTGGSDLKIQGGVGNSPRASFGGD